MKFKEIVAVCHSDEELFVRPPEYTPLGEITIWNRHDNMSRMRLAKRTLAIEMLLSLEEFNSSVTYLEFERVYMKLQNSSAIVRAWRRIL